MTAMGMSWGDKGCEYRPDRCEHEPDDGCEWCCMRCNTDTHWCPGCGTVSDHRNTPCGDCAAYYDLPGWSLLAKTKDDS